jgi:N-acetylmuramoyl-L-alanine amidase
MILTMLGSAVSFAAAGTIQIKLDGKSIACDSPPVIVDGRTLIPARALFEAMGGAVTWNGPAREVIIDVGGVNVKLKIDSKKAYINGTETVMDVAPKIIKNRTMIPVRFVSEAAGCQVSWDGKNRIVSVVSPEKETERQWTTISGIRVSTEGNEVTVETDGEIGNYTSFKMTNPSRLVVDIKPAKLNMEKAAVDTADNPYFYSIRYSQYAEDTVRITADLAPLVSGTVKKSDPPKSDKSTSKGAILITFEKQKLDLPGELSEPSGSTSKEDQEILDRYHLPSVVEEARHKLVVIDPGHGGTDTGSRGYENGAAVLNEKDVNLDIALRVREMLKAAGIRLYMIRTEDITVPLYDRQDTANLLEASLYVSIHNNSYTTDVPSGTEVHYHGKDDPPVNGISAPELAENLQKTLTASLGLLDRGTKVSPELAVLRRTSMPAIIIEGAFISNPGDLSYMMTDDFREKYAVSVASCIIEALNNSI